MTIILGVGEEKEEETTRKRIVSTLNCKGKFKNEYKRKESGECQNCENRELIRFYNITKNNLIFPKNHSKRNLMKSIKRKQLRFF